ncbi:MAG: YvcK family protein [Candidatus Gracilibacteria bacterium]|nr:YvcK family protein [Candidatus Gracilibacteria bacterium]
MMVFDKVNITTIGGGTGTYNVLSGLKTDDRVNLAALVAMSDSGGSTGVLRDEFGILPPGDIRRAVLALSKESQVVRKLFEYRFQKDSSVSGHTVGNLLLTAMADITGDFDEGLKQVCKMFRVQGKVIPVTTEISNLGVILENGEKVIGETNIDVPKHDPNMSIKQAFLTPEVSANTRGVNTLENSDIIIIGPGDLYTSIIPNLLVKGVSEAIKNSNAKVVYFCNIMTKHGETTGFGVEDFVSVIEKYLGEGVLDYVVVNNGYISDELAGKYYDEEMKKPVKVKDDQRSDLKKKYYKLIERDLLNEKDYIRHSPEKMCAVISDLIDGWIK